MDYEVLCSVAEMNWKRKLSSKQDCWCKWQISVLPSSAQHQTAAITRTANTPSASSTLLRILKHKLSTTTKSKFHFIYLQYTHDKILLLRSLKSESLRDAQQSTLHWPYTGKLYIRFRSVQIKEHSHTWVSNISANKLNMPTVISLASSY